MKRIVLILAIVMLVTSAFGQETADGNSLLVQCHQTVRILDGETNLTMGEARDADSCLAVVRGMFDGLVLGRLIGSGTDDVTMGQAVRIVEKYLNDHPERLHERDTVLIYRALATAFPRRRKAGQ